MATIREILSSELDEAQAAELEAAMLGDRAVADMTPEELCQAHRQEIAEISARIEEGERDVRELEELGKALYLRRYEAHMHALKKHATGRHLIEAFSRTGEASICHAARFLLTGDWFKGFIPHTEHDKIIFEYGLPKGRADIAFFHLDGSITVVEAKDGSQGSRLVLAGIGQVGYYATQLGSKNTGMKIRRALLWTTTGDKVQDGLIADACEIAGVISMRMREVSTMMVEIQQGVLHLIDEEMESRRRKVYAELSDDDRALLKQYGLRYR